MILYYFTNLDSISIRQIYPFLIIKHFLFLGKRNFKIFRFNEVLILKVIPFVTENSSLANMDDLSEIPLNVIVFYTCIVLFMILIMLAGMYRLCRTHNGSDYAATRRIQIPAFSTSMRVTTDNTISMN